MSPVEMMERVDKMAANRLWNGFDMRRIPVAVFDGTSTWLFGHDKPGDRFHPIDGRPDTYLYEGLHDSVRGNSVAVVNGVETATVMLDGIAGDDVSVAASVVVHEMFHVFQSARYAERGGNLVHMYDYPVEDVRQLQLRRLETEAVSRALRAADGAISRKWCAEALKIRRRRYDGLPPEYVEFERATERHEGLAHYIEIRSLGRHTVELPEAEFAPDAVRKRCYPIGCAFALLLDRFAENWSERFAGRHSDLDGLLASVVDAEADPDIGFGPEETDRALRQAENDISDLLRKRRETKRSFYDRTGFLIELRFGEALRLTAMDPSNVHTVGESEVRHSRFVRLEAGTDRIEMTDGDALTESAGKHPLFAGICAVAFFAADEPVIERKSGMIAADHPGLRIRLSESRVTESVVRKIGTNHF
ncbi:hypothetical protein [Paenibacillus sp. GYB003]|uniref:hypothetical protein n=1 Tax=Paenibacillus sp. GYB003 TaxID=2994392 RepID=UPI002F9693F7